MRKQGDIYFLIQWADPTESVNRFPWMQQADGSWQQLMNKDDTGHDNTYYEDKMAILWNINLKSFKKKGCAAACHMAKGGMQKGIVDKAPGRKYTKSWHHY
ncbi:ethylbenzene dehydrogenase-related protein [Moritella marina]|uniref:ethylbenzene dehydrogenase-related protein n=1 Tax=Moritella marina TaxID=90736 RepID=UPI0037049ED7